MMARIIGPAFALAVAAAASPAWGAQDLNIGMANTRNDQPDFVGDISATYYGATSPASPANPAVQDLLTAGLGKTGLQSAVAPGFVNPVAPTARELRQRAIHTNYRALLDPLPTGGFGTLYGPNVDKAGNVTASEGLIPGWEYLAYADDGSGRQNVTLMVQVPDSFSPDAACIVSATSSGSRGIYGAIGTSGDWGLKHGCAVAYGQGLGQRPARPDGEPGHRARRRAGRRGGAGHRVRLHGQAQR